MVIAVIVVSIYIFTDEEKPTQCEISNSTDLQLTQIGSVLMIQWDINEPCIRNYKVSLETLGSYPNEVLTDKNYYVYQDLDYCSELTVVVHKETIIISKKFTPEIGKVNNLEIVDGLVMWENKHFRSCRYKVKFSDLDEYEVDDFFNLPALDTCKPQSLTITPFKSENIGKSTTKEFELEIGEISQLEITPDKMQWDNTQVKSCDIEIYINGDLSVTITSGDNFYIFTPSLMFCTPYEIKVTAIERNLRKTGNTFSQIFEDGPIIETFEINNLIATWENSHPNCIYSIELDGNEIVCKVPMTDTSTCIITSIEPELCVAYKFELKSQRIDGETKYISAEYNYTTIFDTIDDFDVNDMTAKWKYLGPSCDYEILVNDKNPIPIDNEDSDLEYYTKEISTEILDICKSENEVVLIAMYGENDRELGRSDVKTIPIHSDLIKIEELTLNFNDTNQKLVAEWKGLGESCSYNVKYEGRTSKEFKTSENSVILDDELGFTLEYCTTHTVSVNVKSSDVESTNFTKDLTQDFEAISETISAYLPNKILKIQWDLKEEFKPCADIYYKVSGYIDNPKPDMIDTDSNFYIFQEYTINPNTNFYVEIQAVQRSNNENEEIKGSIKKCTFKIESDFVVHQEDCIYYVN
nr:uncharacterized protein LOC111422377 [Onthophagus taurus]XP_022911348.1 uncharacterized protein LOC111422377 [Onthophagus taurus]